MSLNSVGECWVPEHVKEYLRGLGSVLPLDDMEAWIRSWDEWLVARAWAGGQDWQHRFLLQRKTRMWHRVQLTIMTQASIGTTWNYCGSERGASAMNVVVWQLDGHMKELPKLSV